MELVEGQGKGLRQNPCFETDSFYRLSVVKESNEDFAVPVESVVASPPEHWHSRQVITGDMPGGGETTGYRPLPILCPLC